MFLMDGKAALLFLTIAKTKIRFRRSENNVRFTESRVGKKLFQFPLFCGKATVKDGLIFHLLH